ncbi:hypothetical protein M431DRAFT_452665 [Trichoderma harzianum CBS 226.95]|uniref:Uncharacterized protein n=1 Tax=Trichoderma harzianum CBS 226.95 TaxID=983964 RepID=A0A2T4AAY0_TRIHA|nr:hypothetical protein M431DRAFT_452665 [Trichoderma harzianum CBS 226.95]PTB54216.1 hypothetical protein M431DRAFT_452665 [Trichoderma harzianum CBS 226.95]
MDVGTTLLPGNARAYLHHTSHMEAEIYMRRALPRLLALPGPLSVPVLVLACASTEPCANCLHVRSIAATSIALASYSGYCQPWLPSGLLLLLGLHECVRLRPGRVGLSLMQQTRRPDQDLLACTCTRTESSVVPRSQNSVLLGGSWYKCWPMPSPNSNPNSVPLAQPLALSVCILPPCLLMFPPPGSLFFLRCCRGACRLGGQAKCRCLHLLRLLTKFPCDAQLHLAVILVRGPFAHKVQSSPVQSSTK